VNKPIDFSVKRFVRVWLLWAFGFWLVVGLISYVNGALDSVAALFIWIGGGLFALWMCACWYSALLVWQIRPLNLSSEELRPGEKFCLQPPTVITHFRSGRALLIWEAIGGKLFLTNRRLIFVALRGQFWHYRIDIDLEEIVTAEACNLFGPVAGGLRVGTTAGKSELFNFGAVRYLQTSEWAAAIMLARYRSDPERDWSETSSPTDNNDQPGTPPLA
jgi:hypothetical protein